MNQEQLKQLLRKISEVKIAVYGDFCLDAYWGMDSRKSEISVETGLKADVVATQNYTLGGAANVVANLAALKPKKLHTIGVYGDDIFGREMIGQLQALDIDTSGLLVQEDDFSTMVFCKRILEGVEQPRIDFGVYNKHSESTDRKILKCIQSTAGSMDVFIINQQVPGSLSDSFIDELNKIIADFPDTIFLVDSRNFSARFKNVFLKVNESEAARVCGVDATPDDVFSLEKVKAFAAQIFKMNEKPVFVTRGSHGLIACDKDGLHEVHGLQILKKIDSVGAGDTIVSTLACMLAADATTSETMEVSNFAAGVTVQKIFQTGVASPEEIVEIAVDPDYIFQPELAEDLRHAAHFEKSEIELCYPLAEISCGEIKHAVFDHDGTISALREGWEQVMEPVMIQAVLGEHYESADETLYHKVVHRVRHFIDQSTGIQTVVQMEGLIEIVREFGLVPADKVLDKFGYKEIYNDALMEMVNQRITKLENGELDVNDFIIKGAVEFLQFLRDKNVTLYLASGTDREDVINEAKAMGYADLFSGGIFGAIGDISKYSKKIVLNNIIRDNNLHGSELITLGDGPVELRECRKVGGTSIGIASDEIRRHGLNEEKRVRLIKAGAHIVIPDFSQSDKLAKILF